MLRRMTLLTLALSLPVLAAAQTGRPVRHGYGPPPVGPSLSAWIGVALPTGEFADYGGSSLGDVVNAGVPIGVEAAYRFNPLFRAGFFLEATPLAIDDSACADGDPCRGSDFQLGLEGQFHFQPFGRFDPWVGAGFGYEWMTIHASNVDEYGPYADRWTYTGWVFPRLSAGLKIPVSPIASIGPYVAWSLGEFNHVKVRSLGSGDIDDKAYHGLFQIGVRGDFDF